MDMCVCVCACVCVYLHVSFLDSGDSYGVRSRDVHDTVYAVGKNVVYCTAAVNVVQDVATGKQRFFMEHTDDIVSLAVHRASGKAVSGQIGKDPSAWVWNVDTLQPICQLAGGHQRGVVCVDFSSDGSQVLSVGLDNDHTVVVWDANTGAKLATGKSGPERVIVSQWGLISCSHFVFFNVLTPPQ